MGVNLSKIKALVVEDDVRGLAVVATLLRKLSISHQINTTGRGVLEQARAMGRVDLVLLDLGLPGTDGYQILKQLRGDPKFSKVVVVAVTALDASTEMPRARAAGFNGFLGKPLNRGRFRGQLERVLSGEEVYETY